MTPRLRSSPLTTRGGRFVSRPRPPLLRQLDHVVVRLYSAVLYCLQDFGHRGQQLHRARVRAARPEAVAVRDRTDERARRIERQRGDVRVEAVPVVALLEEVLLDIRRIERRYRRPALLQVAAHRTERLVAGEVSDEWNDDVSRLHALQHAEVRFVREIAAVRSLAVALEHQ